MGMQIPRTHEAGLRGMCMDPSQGHQVLIIAIIKECSFVDSIACVTGAFLFWYYQLRDEERIGHEFTTQYAACLEVPLCIGQGDGEEACADFRIDEQCS